jgi:hypothetical protein
LFNSTRKIARQIKLRQSDRQPCHGIMGLWDNRGVRVGPVVADNRGDRRNMGANGRISRLVMVMRIGIMMQRLFPWILDTVPSHVSSGR